MLTAALTSADEVLTWLCREITCHGQLTSPRGRRTLELAPCSFTLSDPRARRIANQHRRWNESLAVGELCWHLAGSDDVEAIAYYAKAWRSFSDDGRTIQGSCYGRKIFGEESGASQWDRVRAELRRDPDSRRAVLTIGDSREDLRETSKDVPCLTAFQFLLRDGALHATAFMRSNDVIWGLSYDLYLLTMLQELMAAQLGVALGTYTHVATSMHVYEHHWEMASRIAAAPPAHVKPMAAMTHPEQLPDLLRLERSLRRGNRSQAMRLDAYWTALADPLRHLSLRRHPGLNRQIVREKVPV